MDQSQLPSRHCLPLRLYLSHMSGVISTYEPHGKSSTGWQDQQAAPAGSLVADGEELGFRVWMWHGGLALSKDPDLISGMNIEQQLIPVRENSLD